MCNMSDYQCYSKLLLYHSAPITKFIIVQAFYQEYLVNLTLIATKANSTDFASLLWPKC